MRLLSYDWEGAAPFVVESIAQLLYAVIQFKLLIHFEVPHRLALALSSLLVVNLDEAILIDLQVAHLFCRLHIARTR